MERRLYFIVGDLLACTLTGAAAGWFAVTVIPADWVMLAGMLAGMVMGMATGLVGGILFSPFFGAMEVMLPASLSGMVAGLAVGMAHTFIGVNAVAALGAGALAGFGCLAFTYFLQARLQGPVQ